MPAARLVHHECPHRWPRPRRLVCGSSAVLYRGLRKALEDGKNTSGAADLYYGEMEMRRLSPTSSWSDRLVLWTYWLFSGYGLRASRALAAFGIAVVIFSAAFWAWALVGHPPYGTALLRTFESAMSLLRPPPAGLSQVGELLDAILRPRWLSRSKRSLGPC